jgi:L-lactate dehydrogenase complex protein LldG
LSKREEFLSSVSKALKINAKDQSPRQDRPLPPPLENVMPVIPPDQLAERFEEELKALGCNAYRASTLPSLEGVLRSILELSQAEAVVLSRNPLLSQLQIAARLEQWGKTVDVWPDSASDPADSGTFREACFAADVGITGADFVLAETGSLVLTSFTEGSQLASLAPAIHVILYRRNQLRGSLDEVLQNLPVSRDPNRPSPARSVVFVTGFSRTADIEQILVRGVHGPRDVHAILVEDACLSG